MPTSIFNRWHLAHPWTLPSGGDPRTSLKTLTKPQKVLSLVALAVGLPLVLIGGLLAFYAISGYFKERLVRQLAAAQLPPPAKKAHEAAVAQLSQPAKPIPGPLQPAPTPVQPVAPQPAPMPVAPQPAPTPVLPVVPQPVVKPASPANPPKALLPAHLDPTTLTAYEIGRMTPDQQGALIDHFARRNVNAPSDLSNEQLQGMLRSKQPGAIKRINAQEIGLGHCGRYCINNALQREALPQQEFLELTAEAYMQKLGMSKQDARDLVQNHADFAIDVGILEHILKTHCHKAIKHSTISDLPGFEVSKQQAMEQALDKATWAIIGNVGAGNHDRRPHAYDMPSPGATYPLTAGHFVALRKDEKGEWWYIDSRSPFPVNIALAVVPATCTLIIPT